MLLPAARRRLATALGRNAAAPAARDLTVRTSDVFLVSYPRSGNTWLRFLIANALRPEEQATFATIGDVVPDIYDVTDRDLLRLPDPRVIKSHEPFDARYRRVAYLVRNPADVALSYYHYLIKMRMLEPGYELSRYVARFIGGELDEFGPWGEHVEGWAARDVLLVRYEDMLADPTRSLVELLGLAGLIVEPAVVGRAVERSRPEQLRRLERETGQALSTLRRSRLEDPFIRTARAGAAAKELPPELVQQVLEAWPGPTARLGYA